MRECRRFSARLRKRISTTLRTYCSSLMPSVASAGNVALARKWRARSAKSSSRAEGSKSSRRKRAWRAREAPADSGSWRRRASRCGCSRRELKRPARGLLDVGFGHPGQADDEGVAVTSSRRSADPAREFPPGRGKDRVLLSQGVDSEEVCAENPRASAASMIFALSERSGAESSLPAGSPFQSSSKSSIVVVRLWARAGSDF